jgi:hypothetical protein
VQQIEVTDMQTNPGIQAHCREIIKSCLNIVEQKGDTYVAIHKDDGVECVVLVSMLRTHPILSIIVADKILFADRNAAKMYGAANSLNSESVIGWHAIRSDADGQIYMYRQCIWLTMDLGHDDLMDLLRGCITEYTRGRNYLNSVSDDPNPCA